MIIRPGTRRPKLPPKLNRLDSNQYENIAPMKIVITAIRELTQGHLDPGGIGTRVTEIVMSPASAVRNFCSERPIAAQRVLKN
jgi:hypothetical protein